MTNGSMTLYHKVGNGFKRIYIPNVYWKGSTSSSDAKSGRTDESSTTIYIFDKIDISEHDMCVKGECNFAFNNSNEETVSKSFKEFQKKHKFVSIKSISDYWFEGSGLKHIEVSCI